MSRLRLRPCGAPPDFAELHRQLEEALSKLKRTKDSEVRRVLLLEMRLLLLDADHLNASRRAVEESR